MLSDTVYKLHGSKPVCTIHHSDITEREERWWNGCPTLLVEWDTEATHAYTTWGYFLGIIKKTAGSEPAEKSRSCKNKALKNPVLSESSS